ncbi:unnamed protein product [Polarella glacialis]|uniref:Protein unc-45 homolog B n=1 Tax=Polarella glacialis TaxID=89957 RepID=A0A813KDX6_POLGL|nr:unnamed protein product [Polarella glacialis]
MAPHSGTVRLGLQATRPVLGKCNVQRDAVMSALSSGRKELVLPVLLQLREAGQSTLDTLKLCDSIGRLLRHEDPEVSAAAALVLGCSGSVGLRHQEELVILLRHPQVTCRTAALSALGQLGLSPQRKDVCKQVVACLTDLDSTVRIAALRTLASLGATRQAEAVSVRLEKDQNSEVAGTALEVLGRLSVLSREAESFFPPELRAQKCAEMLGHPRTRYFALACLCQLGDKAPSLLAPAVVRCLADVELLIRQAAVAAIQVMAPAVAASSEALQLLQSSLQSASCAERAAAANSLAALGQLASAQASLVADLLQDFSEESSGSNGRRAPRQMRIPRCAALTALGRMAAAQFVDRVAEGLCDRNWEVRMCAAEALGMLGQASRGHASTLIGALRDDAYLVRAQASEALGRLRSVEAMPALAQAFEDVSHTVRFFAVQAAGEVIEFAEEFGHDVFKLLEDPDSEVRAAAVSTLSRMPECGPSYAGVVATMLADAEPVVRCAAATALARLGAAGLSLSEEVSACLEDPSASVRQAAVDALEQMGLRQSLAARPFLGRSPPAGQKDPVEGLGLYYKSIMLKKSDLQLSGRWVGEGIL